jgi:hypothetical protein
VSVIYKLITSVWNKEDLPDQWKESIIVQIHEKGDKTDCNNYGGKTLFSTSKKMLSNILLSRLSPYIDEITGGNQCGFRLNRSTVIRFSAFVMYRRRNWSTMRQYISYS